MADSLQLLTFIPRETMIIADLGSGGGFPGMALACVGDWTVHLYESNQKKVAFLQEVARQTKVKAIVHRMRLEELSKANLPDATIVTARALAPLDPLLGLSLPFFQRGATGLFHKGREIAAEMNEAEKNWKISYTKHVSQVDSESCVLEVKEITRVAS